MIGKSRFLQTLDLTSIRLREVICEPIVLKQDGYRCEVVWCADMNVYAAGRMTAVCPSESSPEGAEAEAESRGSGVTRTAASTSGSAVQAVASNGDSVGGAALMASVQRVNRWTQQDSSDVTTDDEGTSVRRLTPLERLNLDMCQDER